ncbi:flavodoxin family protein [bacterium]|nr:MAG: flavodoxin family protein [bacterium]
MKLIILNGSARAGGNTYSLLSRITQSLAHSHINSEIINISEKKVNFCMGCHSCEDTRVCIQKDGVDDIYDSFRKADMICIASPSYWGNITGQLKTFFDRSTPYCNTIDGTTTFPAGKKSCSIALRAGSSMHESEAVILSITHYFSHLEMDHQFFETFENIGSEQDLNTDLAKEKIERFANRIITHNR